MGISLIVVDSFDVGALVGTVITANFLMQLCLLFIALATVGQ